MKTYRNEQSGFEIDIPEQWSFDTRDQPGLPPRKYHVFSFRCRANETFNFQTRALTPEPALSETEDEFRRYAQERGYTTLGLGRFTSAGKEHVWARYYEGDGHWVKKYVLSLDHIEYTFTASCLEQKSLLDMESAWDQVVISFRLLMPVGEATQPASEPEKQKTGGEHTGSQTPAPHKPDGMKTYRNKKHGFEIDIPENWLPAPDIPVERLEALAGPLPPGSNRDFFQYCCYKEAMNFEIGPLAPEPLLDDTVNEFQVFARSRDFTDLHFDRISVAGKEHVCAHYFVNDNLGPPRWNKKYMLVLGGIEYVLTCTCKDPQWFAKREKDWDAIIRSFRMLTPVDDSTNATAQADRERQERRKIVREQLETPQDPRKMYARACQAVALGQYPEARLLLEQYLREKPDHAQARKDLANILQFMGDKSGAIKQLQEVQRLDPSDLPNRSNLARLVAESGSASNRSQESAPAANAARPRRGPVNSSASTKNVQRVKDKTKQDYTLSFSIRSYLLIAALSFLYIGSRGVSFTALLFLTSATPQPLSTSEFNMLGIMLLTGIGAIVCLISLLGVALNAESPDNASTIFGFIERTMRAHDKKQKTLGGLLFSDYTRKPAGVLDALRLQFVNIIHTCLKILMIFFSVGLLHPAVILLIFGVLNLPKIIWPRQVPILWDAGTTLLWFYACYRALLFWLAKKEGVAREADAANSHQATTSPSLDSSIQSAMTKGVTPELINEILCQESVIQAIKNDWAKTDQVGYKEIWRLGLITPDQDRYDPRLNELSRQDRLKKFSTDASARFNFKNQIPLKRSAILHSTGYFNAQFNNVVIIDGKIKQLWPRFSNYQLRTVLNKGEYICIRNIQIDTNRMYAENRSPCLAQFLREDGFPLKESYPDGDPMSTDRGGIIVIDKGKILITYPKYFAQRRLIDNEGNLVNIGMDEDFNPGGIVEAKMQPAVLNSLVQYASFNGYIPVLRYHTSPYTSDFMLPIIDAPISASGWADLFIDPTGKAKLFIAKEKTLAEWVEMMNKLKQLFFSELAKKHDHLLGLSQDKTHLSEYLSKKQEILKDYYIIQDWTLF